MKLEGRQRMELNRILVKLNKALKEFLDSTPMRPLDSKCKYKMCVLADFSRHCHSLREIWSFCFLPTPSLTQIWLFSFSICSYRSCNELYQRSYHCVSLQPYVHRTRSNPSYLRKIQLVIRRNSSSVNSQFAILVCDLTLGRNQMLPTWKWPTYPRR